MTRDVRWMNEHRLSQWVIAEDHRSDPTSRSYGRTLGYLLIMLAFFSLASLLVPRVTYLGLYPDGETYTATRFVFRFGHTTRIVDDPNNHMQWVYGDPPDSITVANGIRTIVYNEPKAIVKSWRDSIDVQQYHLKHKGWMGLFSDGTHFLVDGDGVIQER